MFEDIKQMAGKVSENYLLKNVNMTEAIIGLAREKKLNKELVKRLCELANQNAYLSIFNSSKEKRGNIQFDLADSEKALTRLKELDMTDNDYLEEPADFRTVLDETEEETGAAPALEAPKTIEEHIADLNKKLRLSDRLSILLSAIKSMRTQEEQGLEENINKISNFSRALVFNHESFGDMSKLALRFSQERGYDLEKTAKIFTAIHDHLKNRGFTIEEELTKTSSMKINPEHEMYKPLDALHQNLIKISALRELETGMEGVAAEISRVVLKKKA